MSKEQGAGSPVAGSEFPRLRQSRCAQQASAAELARLRRMTIEDRIAEALSMNDRFSWLRPAAKGK